MTDTTETEWVEGEWGALKIADRVRLIPTDTQAPTIEGYVSNADTPAWLMIRGLGSTQFQAQSYRLYVEAPPKVELPTEPGLYLSAASPTTFPHVFLLKTSGDWWLINTGSFFPVGDGHLERHAPFTRLAPVPETAKKVLERVRDLYKLPGQDAMEDIEQVKREFGVTHD